MWFSIFHFKTYFLTLWPTDWNHFYEFARRSLSFNSNKVLWKWTERINRRSRWKIFLCKVVTTRASQFCPHGHNLNTFGRGPLRYCYSPNMKALGSAVLDKKIFENCIFNLFSDPVTYLCKWPKPFKLFC